MVKSLQFSAVVRHPLDEITNRYDRLARSEATITESTTDSTTRSTNAGCETVTFNNTSYAS